MDMQRLLLMVFLLMPIEVWAQDWSLVWSDEFDGDVIDTTKWSFQIGDGCPDLCGWGNNELEWYRAENASVSDGYLKIEARQEAAPAGKAYTSARMRTINRGDWTYGRYEVRAKMPVGKGIWPAIWMLPTDPSIYGTWAASGEIDIMEYVGDKPSEVFGTIHYGGSWPDNLFSSTIYTLDSGGFNDDFHTFAFEWEPRAMRWYVDGELYATQTDWFSSSGPFPAPFDVDFHLILNVAVGGNLPGNPDASTSFPQAMLVDYVRVYQDSTRSEDTGSVFPFDSMEHGNPFGADWFVFNGSEGGGGIGPNQVDLPPGVPGQYALEAGFGGNAGFIGGFGRTRPLSIPDATHFSFWINPDPNQTYTLEINLQEDDNGDEAIPEGSTVDDEFQYNCAIGPNGPCAIAGGGWQSVSIPLSSFADDNSFLTGGNGQLDMEAVGSGGNGPLVNVVWAVIGTGGDASFRTDQWEFRGSTNSAGTSRSDFLPVGHVVGSVFPNPVGNEGQLLLRVSEPQQIEVSLYDMLGRLQKKYATPMVPADTDYYLSLDTEDLTSGVYLVTASGRSWSTHRLFTRL